jgi:hypothetical protein
VLALICLIGVPVAVGGTPALMWAADPYTTAVIMGTGGLALAAFCYRCLILSPRRKHRPATARDSASA